MKNNRSPLYLLCAVLILVLCISPVSAQTPPPKPESAADNIATSRFFSSP